MGFLQDRRLPNLRTLRSLNTLQLLLGGGTILFLLFRVWLVRDAILDPSPRLFIDSEQYLSLAQSLLENGRYEDPTGQNIDLFRSPGYAGFLAIILAVSGRSLGFVIVVQLALNLACAVILAQLGPELGRPRVGGAAALVYLVSPNSFFWSVAIMSEMVFAAGLILCLLLTLRAVNGAFPTWMIGILLAFLAYIRPIGMYLIPIWVVAIYLAKRRTSSPSEALRSSLACFVASVVMISPWYIRNVVKHDEVVFATVSRTTIQSYHIGLVLADAKGISWEEAKTEAFAMGGGLDPILRLGVQYPASFLKVQLKGILRTSMGLEVPTWEKLISGFDNPAYGLMENALTGNLTALMDNFRSIFQAGDTGFLGLMLWGMGYNIFLLIASLLGLFRAQSLFDADLRFMAFLMVIVIGYLAIIPGAAGEARFRVPVEPLLAFLAGLTWLPKRNPNMVGS